MLKSSCDINIRLQVNKFNNNNKNSIFQTHQIISLAGIFIHISHCYLQSSHHLRSEMLLITGRVQFTLLHKLGLEAWSVIFEFARSEEKRVNHFKLNLLNTLEDPFFCVCLLIIQESFNFEMLFFFDFAISQNYNIEILFSYINLRRHINEKYNLNSELYVVDRLSDSSVARFQKLLVIISSVSYSHHYRVELTACFIETVGNEATLIMEGPFRKK